jgi:hypothetical protein
MALRLPQRHGRERTSHHDDEAWDVGLRGQPHIGCGTGMAAPQEVADPGHDILRTFGQDVGVHAILWPPDRGDGEPLSPQLGAGRSDSLGSLGVGCIAIFL